MLPGFCLHWNHCRVSKEGTELFYQWTTQLPLTLISLSERGTNILPFLSFSPNFPLNHFYDYKYLSLFFHYGDTYTLKGYLFHLPVLSLPVCPFQRLNSGTVAKQLYIIAASHQLLIVPSTLALQIWTASDNGTASTAKNTLRGFFAQQRQRR